MSKVCDICKKGPMVGNSVSHAHNLTKRRFLPNLKKVKVVINGTPTTKNVCMKCLKSGKYLK